MSWNRSKLRVNRGQKHHMISFHFTIFTPSRPAPTSLPSSKPAISVEVIQLRVKRNGSKLGLAVAASKSHLGLLVRGRAREFCEQIDWAGWGGMQFIAIH